MAEIVSNPDSRPLPAGWIQNRDIHGAWYYLNTTVAPPQISYTHPGGPGLVQSPPPATLSPVPTYGQPQGTGVSLAQQLLDKPMPPPAYISNQVGEKSLPGFPPSPTPSLSPPPSSKSGSSASELPTPGSVSGYANSHSFYNTNIIPTRVPSHLQPPHSPSPLSAFAGALPATGSLLQSQRLNADLTKNNHESYQAHLPPGQVPQQRAAEVQAQIPQQKTIPSIVTAARPPPQVYPNGRNSLGAPSFAAHNSPPILPPGSQSLNAGYPITTALHPPGSLPLSGTPPSTAYVSPPVSPPGSHGLNTGYPATTASRPPSSFSFWGQPTKVSMGLTPPTGTPLPQLTQNTPQVSKQVLMVRQSAQQTAKVLQQIGRTGREAGRAAIRMAAATPRAVVGMAAMNNEFMTTLIQSLLSKNTGVANQDLQAVLQGRPDANYQAVINALLVQQQQQQQLGQGAQKIDYQALINKVYKMQNAANAQAAAQQQLPPSLQSVYNVPQIQNGLALNAGVASQNAYNVAQLQALATGMSQVNTHSNVAAPQQVAQNTQAGMQAQQTNAQQNIAQLQALPNGASQVNPYSNVAVPSAFSVQTHQQAVQDALAGIQAQQMNSLPSPVNAIQTQINTNNPIQAVQNMPTPQFPAQSTAYANEQTQRQSQQDMQNAIQGQIMQNAIQQQQAMLNITQQQDQQDMQDAIQAQAQQNIQNVIHAQQQQQAQQDMQNMVQLYQQQLMQSQQQLLATQGLQNPTLAAYLQQQTALSVDNPQQLQNSTVLDYLSGINNLINPGQVSIDPGSPQFTSNFAQNPINTLLQELGQTPGQGLSLDDDSTTEGINDMLENLTCSSD